MVKIIVLVKQVVQSAELKVDRTTKTLVTQGAPQVIHVGLSGQEVSPGCTLLVEYLGRFSILHE